MIGVELADTIREAVSGSQRAWDSLVDNFANLVWGIARAHGLSHADASDVSQTVWLRLAEHIARIREPERIAGWLTVTTRNEAVRVLKRRQNLVPVSNERLAQSPPIDDRSPDAGLIADESSSELWRAFERIPTPCRVLLRLMMEDPSPTYATVSEVLGMPIGSIGPRRARCLEHLREEVEQETSIHSKLAQRSSR